MAEGSIAVPGQSNSDDTSSTQNQQNQSQSQNDGTKGVSATWRDSLPDDLKASKSLEKFNDVPALAKSYTELEKHVGGTVKMLDEKSSPEERDAFWNRLGRPEKADGYKLDIPEDLPAGTEWFEDVATKFKGEAHELGLSQNQLEKVSKFYHENILPKLAERIWTAEKGMGHLKEKWTSQEEVDRNLESVSAALGKTDAEFPKYLTESGEGNNPVVVRALAKLGEQFKEDKQHIPGDLGTAGLDRETALTKIAEIQRDKNHDYHKTGAAGRRGTAEMQELYKRAYPGGKVVAVMP